MLSDNNIVTSDLEFIAAEPMRLRRSLGLTQCLSHSHAILGQTAMKGKEIHPTVLMVSGTYSENGPRCTFGNKSE